MYTIGTRLVKRQGVVGTSSYPERTSITGYDEAYRRFILADGTEMTSASLDHIFAVETSTDGSYL